MTRHYLLAYLPSTQTCPWAKYREAFVARFTELFGEPIRANFLKLADRLSCSEDTVRRLWEGLDHDRHVFPRADALGDLEQAMEMAPGSLGARFKILPPPQAAQVQEIEGTPVLAASGQGKDTMPLGADLEDHAPAVVQKGAFYEISLQDVMCGWALNLVRNLPRNLIQLSTMRKFPIYIEDTGEAVRLVSLFKPLGADISMSQVFTGQAREKVLSVATPMDAAKVALILSQTVDGLITDAVHHTVGLQRTQDVLGEFRSGIGDLCKINDELKVLQVDTEDAAADPKTKDPRIAYIAKRLKISRQGISALLAHTFPDPQQ